jgi:hypothetical protein
MLSSPSTGAHLGPTGDPPLLAVHHDLNLAGVTFFSGSQPARQAREHPPVLLAYSEARHHHNS